MHPSLFLMRINPDHHLDDVPLGFPRFHCVYWQPMALTSSGGGSLSPLSSDQSGDASGTADSRNRVGGGCSSERAANTLHSIDKISCRHRYVALRARDDVERHPHTHLLVWGYRTQWFIVVVFVSLSLCLGFVDIWVLLLSFLLSYPPQPPPHPFVSFFFQPRHPVN